MGKRLFKRKRGKPLKHDFIGLRVGQAVKFSENAQKNPYPYVVYWNKNKKTRIEVWRDDDNVAYAKRVK